MALSRQNAGIIAFIDNVYEPFVQVRRVGTSINGRPSNYAVLEYIPNAVSKDVTDSTEWIEGEARIQDQQIVELFSNRQVEIRVTATRGIDAGFPYPDTINRIIHFGRIFGWESAMGEQGERLILHSRLDDHMFGEPVSLLELADRTLSDAADATLDNYSVENVDGELIFNPTVDGIPTPNMVAAIGSGALDWPYRVLIDPTAIDPVSLLADRQTIEAAATGGGSPSYVDFWTLRYAAEYLCNMLNGTQTYIKNPNPKEGYDILTGFDDDSSTERFALRNHRVPVGRYLPQALDELLAPHGFGWKIEHGERGIRRIAFFERGVATVATHPFKLQAYGEDLDTEESSVKAFDWHFDMADGATNVIQILGGYEEQEVSVILRPAWNSNYDSDLQTDSSKFNQGNEEFRDDPDVQKAFRLFAANENGFYTTSDPERTWFASALDLSGLFSQRVQRGRRFMPVLTINDEGDPLARMSNGVLLQYWDPDEDSGSGDWLDISGEKGTPDATFVLSENEMSIRFTGHEPPKLLMALASIHGVDELYLRITATIRGDNRISASSDESLVSHMEDPKTLVIDAGANYQYRHVNTSTAATVGGSTIGGSAFASLTSRDGATDGRDAMQEQANKLVARYNVGRISGPLIIEGIDWDVAPYLGTSPKEILGRQIKLTITPTFKSVDERRYPTVVSIEWDVDAQQTRVHFEEGPQTVAG